MQSTKNTGKYRTATKIQEFTGFTGPLGSLPEEGKVEELQKEAEDDMDIASSDEEESSDEED